MKITDIVDSTKLTQLQINILFETASNRATLSSTTSSIPFSHLGIFESVSIDEARYFSKWEQDALPLLLEFLTFVAEAELEPNQISQLFGKAVDHANASGKNRTAVGKAADIGKNVAGKAVDVAKVGGKKLAQAVVLQNKIKNKIGELLQNTKTVKNIDALYDKAVAKLEAAVGGPDSELSKLTKELGAWLRKHPMYGAGIVSVLTLLATVTLGTGGVTVAPMLAVAGVSKSAIIGYFLRFAMELVKGEKLSTAAGKGLWGAMVGAIAHMGVDELQHLIGDPMIRNVYTTQTAADPGVDISSYQTTINIVDGQGNVKSAYLNFLGTPKEIAAIQNIIDKSQQLVNDGKLDDASKLLQNLADRTPYPQELVKQFTRSEKGGKVLTNFMSTFFGKELSDESAASSAIMKVASDFESHVRTLSQGLAAAANAGAAGFAGTERKNTEALNEVDFKGAWDKTKGLATKLATTASAKLGQVASEYTNQVTQKKLRAAWENANRPTDSAAIAKILAAQGFDNNAITTIFKDAGLEDQTPAMMPPDTDTSLVDTIVSNLSVDLGNEGANNILTKVKAQVEALLKSNDPDAKTKAMALLKKSADEVAKFTQPAATQPAATQPASSSVPASNPEDALLAAVKGRNVEKIKQLIQPKSLTNAGLHQVQTALAANKRISNNKKNEILALLPNAKIVEESAFDMVDKMLKEHNVSWSELGYVSVIKENNSKKVILIAEYASGGSTSAGSVASLPGAGGPLMPMIRRMPAGQSFFGPAGTLPPKKSKITKKQRKKS